MLKNKNCYYERQGKKIWGEVVWHCSCRELTNGRRWCHQQRDSRIIWRNCSIASNESTSVRNKNPKVPWNSKRTEIIITIIVLVVAGSIGSLTSNKYYTFPPWVAFFVHGTEYNNTFWNRYHTGLEGTLIHELPREDATEAFNRVCNYRVKINSLWYLET